VPPSRRRLVQICGDPTVDWIIIKPDESQRTGEQFWREARRAVAPSAGGAALVTRLVEELCRGAHVAVQGVRLDNDVHLASPIAGTIRSALTVWKPIDESRTGYRIADSPANLPGRFAYGAIPWEGTPECLVIDDAGVPNGFRHQPHTWPPVLQPQAAPAGVQHVIVKLAGFSDRSARLPVLDRLCRLGLADRTTVVVSVGNLRRCDVRIGPPLSWERTFEGVVDAVLSGATPFGDRRRGLRFARVVVTVDLSGAVVVQRSPSECLLCFDRSGQERDWVGQHQGDVLGHKTCMVAALTKACLAQPEQPSWGEAVRTGLVAARELHRSGFVVPDRTDAAVPEFPFQRLVPVLADGARSEEWQRLAVISGALGDLKPGFTILSQVLPRRTLSEVNRLFDKAKEIATSGPDEALTDVPVETVGHWRSGDRFEIEGVRSVRNTVREYLASGERAQPLCIAVFGPPGSGKSFAVNQIAESEKSARFQAMTFNLTQFRSPDELATAFHQIRDTVLAGQMPLAFWDEFDTRLDGQPLGWLPYFLAPMQDGRFREMGGDHPIGAGVHVFAGGVYASFDEFRMAESCGGADVGGAKAVKLPDFVSRLRGYINVSGPNPAPDSVRDRYYMVRRAFLFHGLMKRFAGHLVGRDGVRVEDSVLHAFLKVGRYKHGARSLEALIRLSELRGKSEFGLSSLPTERQLSLHVDPADFMELTRLGGRPILKIGITGHRILMDTDKIRHGVKQAMGKIDRLFPGSLISIFSQLDQGADQLVADAIREIKGEGTRLIAVLPMPEEQYKARFEANDERTKGKLQSEFEYLLCRATEVIAMPPARTTSHAYEEASHFVAGNCDLMVAVYDGAPALGRGGTGEVCRHAVERGIPVFHVKAGNRQPGTLTPTTLGKEQGKLVCYNLP